MEEQIVVSIVMPAYNAAATVAESINSVQQQRYSNWELLVVNDGSKDSTADIVSTFAKSDKRIRLLDLPRNGGLPNARNQGCLNATGTFVAFLDSDDLWNAEKLSKQVAFHRSNPNIDVSHTGFEMFGAAGTQSRKMRNLIEKPSDKEGNLYPSICYANPIGVLTVMAKTDHVKRAGLFDTSLWTLEDQDLWIRLAKQGSIFGYIPEVLASYRLSSSGITSKTGRYKAAYKKFIRKVLTDSTLDRKLVWRSYFRYFGTAYFKRGDMKLSRMYFWKSIRLRPFDVVALSTWVYLAYAFAKSILSSSKPPVAV